jgi:diadenosine tetraphosphate (Ap4A) HIT family hydrolase
MIAKNYPSDVLEQANSVLTAINQIDNEISFGEVNHAMLTADMNQINPVMTQIMQLETQLTDVRNQRDALSQNIWDKIKRIRMGVKANFGDDSSQYEMVGGTRLSDRKPRSRKVAVAA